MQALDHAAGYMLAFGIQAALCQTITVRIARVFPRLCPLTHMQEGGSWEVRVSLAAVGRWIRSLGQLDPAVAFRDGPPLPPRDMHDPRYTTKVLQTQGVDGAGDRKVMTAVAHAAKLSATPVKEGEAPMRLDAHLPEWLPREQ